MLTTNADMVLKYMFPNWKEGDWELGDMLDGTGSFIRYWHRPESIPTIDEINDNEAAALEDLRKRTHPTEEEWQEAKSPALKMIENIYIDFLTNYWTPLLRSKGIIASDYSITVENTDEMHNIQYLLTLRAMDIESYYKMAGEFERLKNNIITQGGIMSRVKYHA